jgi:hypothetical protein
LGIAAVTKLGYVGGYKTWSGATVAQRLACHSDIFNLMVPENIEKLVKVGPKEEKDNGDFMCSNNYTLPHFQHPIDSFVAAVGDCERPFSIFGVKKNVWKHHLK